MRKLIRILGVALLVAGAVVCLWSTLFAWKMRNTEIHMGRIALLNSLPSFLETGSLSNQWVASSPERSIFPLTNTLHVAGKTYGCVVGYKSSRFEDSGFLAVATNGVVLWVDSKRSPKLVDRNYVTRFLPPGF
jgi:hypothetical protein